MEAFICAVFLDQNLMEWYSETVKKLDNQRLIGPGWQIENAFIENLLETVVDFEENYKRRKLQRTIITISRKKSLKLHLNIFRF